MKYLVTGATGLVGTSLVNALLQSGIGVHYLTTRVPQNAAFPGARGFRWDPIQGTIDTEALEGLSTVIHLAGASIAKPWTKA